jgi:hypothetical protein
MSTLTTMQRAVALGAASLALAASPAMAQPDPPVTHVTQSPAGAAHATLDLRSPDAVDAGSTQAPRTSSLAGTTSASTPKVSAVTSSDTGDGIDWSTVAIAAGAVVAVGLLGAAAVAMTHRGHLRTAR